VRLPNQDGLESNQDGLESAKPDLQSMFKKPGGGEFLVCPNALARPT
jgi:hypothetical protein